MMNKLWISAAALFVAGSGSGALACRSSKTSKGDGRIAELGESCTGVMAPEYMVTCAAGLTCEGQKDSMGHAVPGAGGICVKEEDSTSKLAGPLEPCNELLSPADQIHCESSFACKPQKDQNGFLPGKGGICVPKHNQTLAKEGKKCNMLVTPDYWTVCQPGLHCHRKSDVPGADGVCVKNK